MVNANDDREPTMRTTLQYLRKRADEIFETQMRRAACRIDKRQQFFPHRAA